MEMAETRLDEFLAALAHDCLIVQMADQLADSQLTAADGCLNDTRKPLRKPGTDEPYTLAWYEPLADVKRQ